MGKNNKLGIHERAVESLADRLRSTDRYDTVETHVFYGPRNNEMDVMAQRTVKRHGRYVQLTHYYEVKCTLTPGSLQRAKTQIKEFYRVRGEANTKALLHIVKDDSYQILKPHMVK